MSGQLVLHRGGWEATKADLASVPVPSETDSYVPVPMAGSSRRSNSTCPDRAHDHRCPLCPRAGRDADVRGADLPKRREHADYALAIGLRNSYDRSLSASLTAGSRVFVCDNLAFSGEADAARKHTVNIFRDLPDLIYRMLSKVSSMQSRIHSEIAAMKARSFRPRQRTISWWKLSGGCSPGLAAPARHGGVEPTAA